MPLVNDDPLTQIAFSIYENKGVFALLLGSGLSRAAEIPTGWEITLDLVRRVATAKGVAAQADWAAWHRAEIGGEPDYSALLAELATTPAERRAILDSYIEPTAEERGRGAKVPTAAHRAIAQLVVDGYLKVIVTTNFDRLMENALREAGVEPVVIASTDALAGAQPLAHAACFILKVHGDYKDDRILNTEEELAAYPAAYDTLLDRILDEYGLIICGWSGVWDRALRAAILRAPNRRYTMYWASRGPVAVPAQDLIDHRKAKVISITDADSLFRGIADRVMTLETTRAQNPLSIELVVSTAKRFVANPEYRVSLSDLIESQVRNVMSAIHLTEEFIGRRIDPPEFVKLLGLYEAATEPLAKLLVVLGRWGLGSDVVTVTDMICHFLAYGQDFRGGNPARLSMRQYPSLLCLCSYGLGLAQAKRWSDLRSILTCKVYVKRTNETMRVADLLTNNVPFDLDNGIWKWIPELERHISPLSEYLYRLMLKWHFTSGAQRIAFEKSYNDFETISGLVYFEKYTESQMTQTATALQSRTWVGYAGLRLPALRCAWERDAFKEATIMIEDNDFREKLLQSGFCDGRRNTFTYYIENLAELGNALRPFG